MNEARMKTTILEWLKKTAPDTEPDTLSDTENYRTALGMDSFDFLQFMMAVSNQFSIEIPEQDYISVSTLKGLIEYIAAKQG